jgi:hypothetical protein
MHSIVVPGEYLSIPLDTFGNEQCHFLFLDSQFVGNLSDDSTQLSDLDGVWRRSHA